MTMRVKVEGLRELGESMRRLGGDVSQRLIFRATLAGAKIIQAKASALAPQSEAAHRVGKGGPVAEPGNLKRGIATKRLKRGAGKAKYEVRWKAKKKGDPFYGLFVEFGTATQPGKPFMRPAFDQSKGEALQAVQTSIGKGISAAAKRAAKARAASR